MQVVSAILFGCGVGYGLAFTVINGEWVIFSLFIALLGLALRPRGWDEFYKG